MLYIEDNLSNLRLVERVLGRPAGGPADLGHAGPQLGLDLAGEHQPDLILLDLHLPDMHGERGAARAPRTTRRPPTSRSSILSADATAGQIERLLAEGAAAYLTKPLDVRELLGLVDGVAAEREQAATG